LGPLVQPLQQPLQQLKWQPNARFAVAGVGEVDPTELPQRPHGDVAAEDLQEEEADGHQWRQHTFPPDVALLAELLLQRERDAKISDRVALEACQYLRHHRHPWPPVWGVVEQHHHHRRPRLAQARVTRVVARSYVLSEWHSSLSR